MHAGGLRYRSAADAYVMYAERKMKMNMEYITIVYKPPIWWHKTNIYTIVINNAKHQTLYYGND